MKLNYRKLGQGKPLFVLHGVFGSSDNLQTIGKMLEAKNEVYLIDLRNHGLSPHHETFNYSVMSADIEELMLELGISQVNIMGHSMGGKVAINFAINNPKNIDKLIVVDIAPRSYPPHHQEVLAGFHSVKLDEISSRKEAEEQMSAVISNFGVRQFLLKNLSRDEKNKYSWKLNLRVIEQNLAAVGAALESHQTFSGTALFIKGELSDYITEADEGLIKKHFPNADIKTIANAGHWVHAEQPQKMFEIVDKFLTA